MSCSLRPACPVARWSLSSRLLRELLETCSSLFSVRHATPLPFRSGDECQSGTTKEQAMQKQSVRRIYPDLPVQDKRPIVVSVDEPSGSALAPGLDRAGLALSGAVRWGSESACASLLERRPAMMLLDLPTTEVDGMARLVRAASLIAPVGVLRHEGLDAVVAFAAGAFDVIDRRAPAAELAWRIHADLRRCPPTPPPPAYARGTASQRLLFDVLARAQAPVCCHHLRLLLGTLCLPMTLRALRARIRRLLPTFADHALELVVDQQWGLATFRTWSAGDPGSPAPVRRGRGALPNFPLHAANPPLTARPHAKQDSSREPVRQPDRVRRKPTLPS
jgi:hypothetical protein